MELQLEQAKPPRTCSLWHHLTALWTPGETCHGQLGAGHPSALILGDTGCFGKPRAPQQRTRGRCVCSHLPEQQEEPRTRGVAKRRACSHQRAQHPLPRLGAQDGEAPSTPGGSASLQRDKGQGHGAQDGSAHRGNPGSTSGIAPPCLSSQLLCPTAQEPHTRSDHVTSDLGTPTAAVIRGTNKGELQKPHGNGHGTILPHQPTVTPPVGLVGPQCIGLSHCPSLCQPGAPTHLHPA